MLKREHFAGDTNRMWLNDADTMFFFCGEFQTMGTAFSKASMPTMLF